MVQGMVGHSFPWLQGSVELSTILDKLAGVSEPRGEGVGMVRGECVQGSVTWQGWGVVI